MTIQKIDSFSQPYYKNSKINTNSSNLLVQKNGNDSFISTSKKAIIAGLGTITFCGLGFLAKKGTFGNKIKNFIDKFFNTKQSHKKTKKEKSEDIPPEKEKPAEISTNQEIISDINKSSLQGKKIKIKTKEGKAIDCELSITKLEGKYEKISIKSNGKTLGYSKVKSDTISDYLYCTQDIKNYLGDSGALYIEIMESYEKGIGIGKELHNAHVIRSRELGHKGKVHLTAAWDSPGFHYKYGFRATKEADNQFISDDINNGEKTNMGSVYMILPVKS